MLEAYVGMPYNLHNKNGLNCWALVALVYSDLFDAVVPDYKADNLQAVSAAFTAAFAEGLHGFTQVDEPKDFDVVIMKSERLFHCGIWYQGKVLHANNGAKQVTFERFKDATRNFKVVEFWRK